MTTNTAAIASRCRSLEKFRPSYSLAVELTRLLVERRALLDGYEALHTELLPSLPDGRGPLADARCVVLLCACGLLPAHDPTVLVLDEVSLLEGRAPMSVATAERDRLRHPLAGLHHLLLHHGLHGLHGFHSLHGLYGLHGLHGLHCESHDW